jgi:hypothetical protein
LLALVSASPLLHLLRPRPSASRPRGANRRHTHNSHKAEGLNSSLCCETSVRAAVPRVLRRCFSLTGRRRGAPPPRRTLSSRRQHRLGRRFSSKSCVALLRPRPCASGVCALQARSVYHSTQLTEAQASGTRYADTHSHMHMQWWWGGGAPTDVVTLGHCVFLCLPCFVRA